VTLKEKCIAHAKTILRHKWYVFIECCRLGIPLQGLLHDLSKFRPVEFVSSAVYFQGDRSPVEAEAEVFGYSYAWRHHKGFNLHHWQWYVDFAGFDEDGSYRLSVAPIPDRYIKEMLADMIGAGKAYGGTGVQEYYESHKDQIIMHPSSQAKFERLLADRRMKRRLKG